MHAFILLTHIVIAVVTLIASVKVIVDTHRRSQSAVRSSLLMMWSSFGVVAGTGIALVVMSPSAMLHTCIMMSAYVVVTSSIHLYQKRTLATA